MHVSQNWSFTPNIALFKCTTPLTVKGAARAAPHTHTWTVSLLHNQGMREQQMVQLMDNIRLNKRQGVPHLDHLKQSQPAPRQSLHLQLRTTYTYHFMLWRACSMPASCACECSLAPRRACFSHLLLSQPPQRPSASGSLCSGTPHILCGSTSPPQISSTNLCATQTHWASRSTTLAPCRPDCTQDGAQRDALLIPARAALSRIEWRHGGTVSVGLRCVTGRWAGCAGQLRLTQWRCRLRVVARDRNYVPVADSTPSMC